MSWFCQGITEDGRLCWLPKNHEAVKCEAQPISPYPNPNFFPGVQKPGKDGSVQLPLPGM